MLTIPPPMSNAERQRLFQERHPGYDRRRKARRRAACQRSVERWKAEQRALAMEQAAAQTAAAEAAAPAAKPLLLLPAPAEDPTMASIEALAASFAAVNAKAAIRR